MAHGARPGARGRRAALDEAETERAAVAALKDDPALKTLGVSSVNAASAIVAIAHEVLAGEIDGEAPPRGRGGARTSRAAVALEDGLIYMEPPDWPIPVRQLQGAALLELGRAKEAEAAFRGDLKKFPDNGWSLSGLQASLERARPRGRSRGGEGAARAAMADGRHPGGRRPSAGRRRVRLLVPRHNTDQGSGIRD